MAVTPYRDFNSALRARFGCRVQKITLDAGLTCPNRDGTLGVGGCIYCNERGSGTGAASMALSLSDQIRNAKSYLAKRYKAKAFIAYFQSYSNTYAPLTVLKSIYGEALADPDVVGLSIGTRPDCVEDDALDLLGEYSGDRLIWMEYGLQSAHDETLARIRRGHSVAAFTDAVRRTRVRGLSICAHVILGLPGEGPDEMLATARFLADSDVQAVKIHLLYVVRGTTLDAWYQSGLYRCLTRDEYVSLVAEFLSLLPPEMIIQRLTGDPHAEELVAPQWALEKRQNLNAIHEYMASRSLFQGMKCVRRP
jgi:hypothetical protein